MMRTHLAMRSFSRDESVKQHKLAPGTVRRILGYARNYRSLIIGFLVLLVVDSLLVVAQPLLFRRIIDDGITPGNSAVVTMSALMVAGGRDQRPGGAGQSMAVRADRRGPDLRSALEVFAHVQRQPIASSPAPRPGHWCPG